MNECVLPKVESRAINDFAAAMAQRGALPGSRVNLQKDGSKNGLAKLALTLVDLLRQLLERQAIRRIDAGSLSEDEIERLGATFMRLADEMERLKKEFGLEDEDLNLDLGPLGKLL